MKLCDRCHQMRAERPGQTVEILAFEPEVIRKESVDAALRDLRIERLWSAELCEGCMAELRRWFGDIVHGWMCGATRVPRGADGKAA